jgi:hypothetical protein
VNFLTDHNTSRHWWAASGLHSQFYRRNASFIAFSHTSRTFALIYWLRACNLTNFLLLHNQPLIWPALWQTASDPHCLWFLVCGSIYFVSKEEEPPLTIRRSMILCLRFDLFSAGTQTITLQRLLYNESPLVLTSGVIYLLTARFISCPHITPNSVCNSCSYYRMR